MSEEIYVDSDGNRCTLDAMCRREPEWAAANIRILRASLGDLREEIAALDGPLADPTMTNALRDGGIAIILCPFHDETTPSCTVREGRYICIGCGATGDVVAAGIRLAPPLAAKVVK